VIEDKKSVKKYFNQLGKHFAEEKDFKNAEMMFLEGGAVTEAVEMYSNSGIYLKAVKTERLKMLFE